MNTLLVTELANEFWLLAGDAGPFPRDLRRPIARVLPMSLVLLPCLRLDSIRAWLHENGIVCPCEESDRRLRACLVAFRGHALVFLDGTDTANEQRFSLAHELAHFLWHYWRPRQRTCRRLGKQIAEVFDGERLPTTQERLHALLKNVPLGLHLHLMRREVLTVTVARAEEEADQLAYELLAPVADVLDQTEIGHGDVGRTRLVEVLQSVFGLPQEQATDYGRLLLPPVWEDPLLKRLRF